MHLTRILVTVDGRVYRTLAPSARAVTVSLKGRRAGAVHVEVTGIARSGDRYTTGRTFRPCVPARPGRAPESLYLSRR